MRLAGAVLGGQLGIGIVCAALWGWADEGRAAGAALFGAFTAALPGFWMACCVLPRGRRAQAESMGRALLWGEIGKLVLTTGLFIMAALLFGPQLLPLLSTYAACLACYWLAMILTR
ncbi:ATP synthase subunit I [Salinisphaera aquimarina]|jgi:F0F1-type ATP synthase assembly protein I|uniref:ATP synthase subunit I n=1 Tax=Salinisphaera aquimarina TaxID=2094031 RepID=A0ABV7EPR5_9GAMM